MTLFPLCQLWAFSSYIWELVEGEESARRQHVRKLQLSSILVSPSTDKIFICFCCYRVKVRSKIQYSQYFNLIRMCLIFKAGHFRRLLKETMFLPMPTRHYQSQVAINFGSWLMPSCCKYTSYALSKGLPSLKDRTLIEAMFRYVSESLKKKLRYSNWKCFREHPYNLFLLRTSSCVTYIQLYSAHSQLDHRFSLLSTGKSGIPLLFQEKLSYQLQ